MKVVYIPVSVFDSRSNKALQDDYLGAMPKQEFVDNRYCYQITADDIGILELIPNWIEKLPVSYVKRISELITDANLVKASNVLGECLVDLLLKTNCHATLVALLLQEPFYLHSLSGREDLKKTVTGRLVYDIAYTDNADINFLLENIQLLPHAKSYKVLLNNDKVLLKALVSSDERLVRDVVRTVGEHRMLEVLLQSGNHLYVVNDVTYLKPNVVKALWHYAESLEVGAAATDSLIKKYSEFRTMTGAKTDSADPAVDVIMVVENTETIPRGVTVMPSGINFPTAVTVNDFTGELKPVEGKDVYVVNLPDRMTCGETIILQSKLLEIAKNEDLRIVIRRGNCTRHLHAIQRIVFNGFSFIVGGRGSQFHRRGDRFEKLA